VTLKTAQHRAAKAGSDTRIGQTRADARSASAGRLRQVASDHVKSTGWRSVGIVLAALVYLMKALLSS
jgi:hypothetical protein